MPSSPAGPVAGSRSRVLVALAVATMLVLVGGFLWSRRDVANSVVSSDASTPDGQTGSTVSTSDTATTPPGEAAPSTSSEAGPPTSAAETDDPTAATAPAEPTVTLAPSVTGTTPPTVVVPQPEPVVDPATAECVAGLSTRVLAGQAVWVMVDHTGLRSLLGAVRAGDVGGVVVMGTPANAATLRADIAALADAAPRGLTVSVDEEGGRVQRLKAVLEPLPSAAEQALWTDEQIRERWRRHGLAMVDLGFTANFAPVVDIGGGPAIGDRSWGDTAAVVSAKAGAAAAGLISADVLPTLKHFPGHGRASNDTHQVLASTPHIDQLMATDLVPYRNLVGSNVAVMMAHLVVPGLTDPNEPASLSPEAYSLLRNEYGFNGLVVTDALNMGAVAGTPRTAAVRAVAAGADVTLVPSFDGVGSAQAIAAAVESGEVPLARLQTAAARALRVTDSC